MHRAFHSPSAPPGLGELELLLLFKWLSSCSFSSCRLLACLWLMTGPSIPVLPSLLHLFPYFFPPFSSTSVFFLTQTADLNVQNKLCWIMDEGSCIIYGATGWGEALCALPLLLAPCAIPCPFFEQTEEVLAPGLLVAALQVPLSVREGIYYCRIMHPGVLWPRRWEVLMLSPPKVVPACWGRDNACN